MARARPDVEAIRGICGMIPTPSTPGADRWSEPMTIAVDETARMVERIVAGGVAILLTNGSLGEGASLTGAEHRVFTATVAEAMAGRGLLFAGVTTLNTRETIERARAAIDAGADGLFMGRPMWMSLDGPSIVAYYADVAEALPGVPIVVYDNPFAFKAKIATETYRALSLNRAIVATKHIGGPAMAEDVRAVAGRMRILPLDQHWAALAKDHPDEALGCWSGNVADGTEPLVALERAVAMRDWDRAEAIGARMAWAQAPMFPDGRLDVFVEYNIPIAHARLEGSGLVASGPPRPPYHLCPEPYLEGGRETGRRWAALVRDYAALAAAGA